MQFFYDIIHAGIRIFLIQLQFQFLHQHCKIIRNIKFAKEKFQQCYDNHIEICIGYQILGRSVRVGRLENDEKIIINNDDLLTITIDRKYSNQSTLSNLFVNCREHLSYLTRMKIKCRGEYIMIGSNLILEILSISK